MICSQILQQNAMKVAIKISAKVSRVCSGVDHWNMAPLIALLLANADNKF